MMDILVVLIPLLFGLIVGSFINVVILRLPQYKGIVWDRSACRSCSTQLSWYENIPLVSYILLRGKCRTCKASISIQYPLIELIHGIVSAYLFYNWPSFTIETLIYQFCFFVITSILISHFII